MLGLCSSSLTTDIGGQCTISSLRSSSLTEKSSVRLRSELSLNKGCFFELENTPRKSNLIILKKEKHASHIRSLKVCSALETPQASKHEEKSAAVSEAPKQSTSTESSSKRLSLSSLTLPVSEDLTELNESLKTVVGNRHPMLMSAAEQIFGAGGKRMRPALIFLVSRATAELKGLPDILPQHRRLAEITEMIHTASLMHDDVLDSSEMRRGKQTVHQKYGTRVAVLAGDFMFAQSSWMLANLDNLPVIKLISQG